MRTRQAHARWEGSLKDGSGEVDCGQGTLKRPYSFASRFEDGKGTNPEELLGAAHASCFAMALSLALGRAGFTPDYVDATAHVTVAPENGGFRITKSHLVCEARVRGMDQAAFGQHAETARANCDIASAGAYRGHTPGQAHRQMMSGSATGARNDVVFLLDVDNTLLDNDRFAADLDERLEQDFGAAGCDRYRAIYAELWGELGYADYLGALQRFRSGLEDDPRLLQISAFLLEYPFEERLYPHALDAIAHLRALGAPAVLSDGDVVFQPWKIRRSGIWAAVEGRVLVYPHKERNLGAVQRRCPAAHYVMVGDKRRLLAAMKHLLGGKLTTVLVRQGHYAAESAGTATDPGPDVILDQVGDLRHLHCSDFALTKRPRSAFLGRHP